MIRLLCRAFSKEEAMLLTGEALFGGHRTLYPVNHVTSDGTPGVLVYSPGSEDGVFIPMLQIVHDSAGRIIAES
jgi:hypothetical protein